MTTISDSPFPSSVLDVAVDNGSLGGADWSTRAVVLEAMSRPLVEGYPAEGTFVQVREVLQALVRWSVKQQATSTDN
uniref:hypothetical protein n=1 Tax=Rhodococcoides fascians TaxID=1828 RepID=UPI00366FB755